MTSLSLTSPIIVSMISLLLSQSIKLILLKDARPYVSTIFQSGGMPSTHSSMVSGLTTSILLTHGIASTEFAIAFIVSSIILYDTIGVRYIAGLNAKTTNHLTKIIQTRTDKDQEKAKNSQAIGLLRNAPDVRFIGERGLPRRRERSEAGVVELSENRADGVFRNSPIPEKMGHTFLEMIVGMLIGICVALVLHCL
jgi:acid phosphatase family membrane protein YuiD